VISIIFAECAALLRYMQVRCEIIDFSDAYPSSAPAHGSEMQELPVESTGEIFVPSDEGGARKRRKSCRKVSSRPQPSTAHPLVQWIQSYFQTEIPIRTWCEGQVIREGEREGEGQPGLVGAVSGGRYRHDVFTPPLYFQHHGHSRTLIGNVEDTFISYPSIHLKFQCVYVCMCVRV
jgi:hypothetical protein